MNREVGLENAKQTQAMCLRPLHAGIQRIPCSQSLHRKKTLRGNDTG